MSFLGRSSYPVTKFEQKGEKFEPEGSRGKREISSKVSTKFSIARRVS